MPGTLFVVATPIGNLEDVSARAVRVLREVALIAAEDTRRTAHLLARYAIATPTTSLHEHNETGKATSLVARLLAGDSIALVSDAGTPTISDPGGRFVREAVQAGVQVEPIPGPSALLALLSVSGLVTGSFTFLGFPPIKGNDRKLWFQELRQCGRTVVFFEAPHRIQHTLEQLAGEIGDVPVVIGRELTKTHEEIIRGPLSQVIGLIRDPRGEFVIALDIGHITECEPAEALSDDAIAAEFGLVANKLGLSRRQTVAALSRKLGLAPNVVYDALERHKKSGI